MRRRSFLGILAGLVGLCWPLKTGPGDSPALPLNPVGESYPEPPYLLGFFGPVYHRAISRSCYMGQEGGRKALVCYTTAVIQGKLNTDPAALTRLRALLAKYPHTHKIEVNEYLGHVVWTGRSVTPL